MKLHFTILLLFAGLHLCAQHSLIALRGASDIAPENTIAAAKMAWELDADALAVGVHLSKDNRLMVINDKDTKRTCNGRKNLEIAKTPSILLRDLDAGVWKSDEFKGERIPFLSEIIKTIPEGKLLLINIKCGKEAIPALERCIEKSGKEKQLAFMSSGWQTILAIHEAFPNNKTYWSSSLKPGLKKKIAQAQSKGLSGVNLKHSIIDEEIMAATKVNELEVLSWGATNAQEAKTLLDLGINGLITKRPKWLKTELAIEK